MTPMPNPWLHESPLAQEDVREAPVVAPPNTMTTGATDHIHEIFHHARKLTESLAKATKGKAGTAVGLPHVRGSTTGTGLRVGEADAVQPATSEIMDVTAGETAPNSRFVLDERAFAEAIEPPPLFLQRTA